MDEITKLNLVKQWNSINGDDTLRLNYPLYKNSVVFDVGAYKGDWSNHIYERHHCKIYAFEPIPFLSMALFKRFSNTNDVSVMNYGILGSNCLREIHVNDDNPDGSSLYNSGGVTHTVLFRDIIDVTNELAHSRVDLIKINVEGSEYDILNRILNDNFAGIFTNIQIQFHDFVEGAEEKRNIIRDSLSKTHKETYCIPFVWENWCLK